MLSKKNNQYYKQLRSLQKDGQEVVISHPYDLSHLVNEQKSFLTTNVIKNKIYFEKKKAPSNVDPKVLKQATNLHLIAELTATPKMAKEVWLQKANESTQERLQMTDTTKNRAILKKMQEQARAQQYTLKSGRAVIHLKRGQQYEASGQEPSADSNGGPGRSGDQAGSNASRDA